MLNFAEQTGSGAVIVVWSLLKAKELVGNRYANWMPRPLELRYWQLCVYLYSPLGSALQ
jgi:hypothetical protein